MYKYLLATDGSENSIRAAEYLLKTAGTHEQVEIHILSVQESAAWFSEFVDAAIEKTTSVFKDTRIQIYTLIKEGDVGDVIVETAASLGIDQIVMGARGLGRIKGMLLGSVSQKVIQLSKCPVTLVK